jgi:hypothetical protein
MTMRKLHGGISRDFLVPRLLLLVVLFPCLLRVCWSDEDKARENAADSHPIVGGNAKTWTMLMTVQGGGGLEAKLIGWQSVQVDSDGRLTVRKHSGHQGRINLFDEEAIANSKATVIFRDSTTAEQRTALFQAAAAAINNFELQPERETRSEDGWRVTLKMTAGRREVSVGARELESVRQAGDDFLRLIEAVNKFLPEKEVYVR